MSNLQLDVKETDWLHEMIGCDQRDAVASTIRHVRDKGGRIGAVKPKDAWKAEDLGTYPEHGVRIDQSYVMDLSAVLVEGLRRAAAERKELTDVLVGWSFIYVWRLEHPTVSGNNLDGMKA